MTHGNGRLARMQVFAVLKAMEKPPHLTLHQWQQIMDVLWAIARRYPNACPGQERLALEARMSVRSCRRYTAMAVELGLLTVWYDAGVRSRGSKSSTSRYLINEQHVEPMELTAHAANLAGPHAANLACKVVGDTHVSPTTESKHPSGEKSSTSHPRVVRAARAARTVTVREVEKSRGGKKTASELIAAANERGYAKRRPRATDPDPGRRLANYFALRWLDLVDELPQFDTIRLWESKGAFIGYVNTVFLRPEAGRRYTYDEVIDYIDGFIAAVRSERVLIKSGQSAWKRFTGWWGRDNNAWEA